MRKSRASIPRKQLPWITKNIDCAGLFSRYLVLPENLLQPGQSLSVESYYKDETQVNLVRLLLDSSINSVIELPKGFRFDTIWVSPTRTILTAKYKSETHAIDVARQLAYLILKPDWRTIL